MKAYKAFSNELTAKMGNHTNGPFKFEPGKKYIEKQCKCAHNGFHCAENPLCCLTYYTSKDSRYFVVEAEGEVNQDGCGSRISCTELTLLKEISLLQMGMHAVNYIKRYPRRELESRFAVRDKGECTDTFLIIVGKNPVAKGKKGSVLFFLEQKNGEIKNICPIMISEDGYKENTYYELKGGKIIEKK